MSIVNLIKGLFGRLLQISAWLAQKSKNLFSQSYKTLRFIFSKEVLGKSSLFVDRFLVARRKSIKFFKGPTSDISHLSIVVIISLALLSGFSASFGTKDEVKVNLLEIESAPNGYTTKTERRIIEADTVATLATIHSESLGSDAVSVAEEIYQNTGTFLPSNDYIMAQPVVEIDSVTNENNAIKKYIVQDGDTLWSIARQFNLTTDTVRYANGIEDENSVKPGVELVILPTVGVLHTVGANDTIAGIAARYGANEAMIIAQNDLYGEELSVGMKIMVPDADIPEAPKPVAPKVTPKAPASSGGTSGSSTRVARTGVFMFPTSITRNNCGVPGNWNGYHNWALDLCNAIGTPILASDSGRIVEAGWNSGGYGYTILIDHGDGFQTRYAHMSRLAIISGYVTKGQVIGYMGSTGRSTGSHLHFEIIVNGSRQNPSYYF